VTGAKANPQIPDIDMDNSTWGLQQYRRDRRGWPQSGGNEEQGYAAAFFSVLSIMRASVSSWNGFCSAGRSRYSSGRPEEP
jgi:hypothetical protein